MEIALNAFCRSTIPQNNSSSLASAGAAAAAVNVLFLEQENYNAKRNHDRNSITECICSLTDTIFDQLTFFFVCIEHVHK